jgi:transcriptional antiterminator NusG
MEPKWFALHTLSGQELKVKDSIEKRLKTEEMGGYIKEVLVPMEKVAEVRGGKKSVTTRKLYPGYVFIDMALLDENQRVNFSLGGRRQRNFSPRFVNSNFARSL